MDLGFETVGNATLIVHDRGPVLVTDPWLDGPAYFGSWIHQHEIPDQQRADVAAAKYVWLSHGHPDHLSLPSLERLRAADVLVPDHVGGRIRKDLEAAGFRVRVLQDGEWLRLSDRVRVLCVSNYFQDAVLLVDLGGRALVVNANDAGDRGADALLRRYVKDAPRSFLTALIAHGDADMIHMLDATGRRIPPPGADRTPLQPALIALLDHYGISGYVPFATLHQYQRADSIWANAHVTRPADLAPRDLAEAERLLPAYVSYDALADRWRPLDPPAVEVQPRAPEDFGDDWSERLERDDVERIATYFRRFEHLPTFLGHVDFVVGGVEHRIALGPHPRGIRFETPRASLLTAIGWDVFDDLMIGNFTRTTMLGDWPTQGGGALYPDFNPFVAKFGDNGGARTTAELRAYFAEYHRRGTLTFTERPDDVALARALAPYLPHAG